MAAVKDTGLGVNAWMHWTALGMQLRFPFRDSAGLDEALGIFLGTWSLCLANRVEQQRSLHLCISASILISVHHEMAIHFFV